MLLLLEWTEIVPLGPATTFLLGPYTSPLAQIHLSSQSTKMTSSIPSASLAKLPKEAKTMTKLSLWTDRTYTTFSKDHNNRTDV